MDSKKLTLIKQMLAKAESTTPEEAEALTEAAEKLMIKHGINQAMIDARRAADSKPEEMTTARVTFTGNYAAYQVRGMAAAASAFGTIQVLMQKKGKRDTDLILIGYESDVNQIKMLVESLILQSVVAMREWWKNYPERNYLTTQQGTMARRQFFASFGYGAADRIKGSLRTATAETTGSELALRDRGQAAAAHMNSLFPRTRRGAGVQGSFHGASEGREAGRRANTGGTALSGSRAALTR